MTLGDRGDLLCEGFPYYSSSAQLAVRTRGCAFSWGLQAEGGTSLPDLRKVSFLPR